MRILVVGIEKWIFIWKLLQYLTVFSDHMEYIVFRDETFLIQNSEVA